MLRKCSIFFILFLPMVVRTDENVYVVNSKRPLHVVSEKFLSVSIDPVVLLTKINLSDVSLQMARHLSPAYVRIAGPSTEFVRYIDTDEKTKDIEDSDNVTVTPSVWFAVNEWFNMANLTPVFGINDADSTMGVWNPKSILPLLEISDKFNLTCLWQLGYDSSNKTETQYVEDLRILRHILDAFPDRKSSWKIVGSNIRKCTHRSGCRRLLDSLKGIADYVVWEQSERDRNMLNDELAHIIFGERNNPKLWTSMPRSHNPATFETALHWAKEVGEAGRNGFDVILRSPRIYEFFVDTPVFWFSVLYKTLVGNVVLDMRSAGSDSKLEAFAYCAKHQNNFNQRGAMVLMVVNEAEDEHTAQIRLSAFAKNMEIQSYILTSKADVRSIYLNGEKLKSSILQQDQLVFTPKLRRAKLSNGLFVISVPAKSIGFFVLPGARVTACMEEEDEMSLLMEEIESDQELPFSSELAVEVHSRNLQDTTMSLKEMERELQEELETDQKFYLSSKKEETHQKLDDILEDLKENYEKHEDPQFHMKIDEETRKKILERAKLIEAQRKLTESEQRLVNLSRMILTKSNKSKHQEKSDEDFESLEKSEKPKLEEPIVKENPKFKLPKLINTFHQPEPKEHNLKKFVLAKPKSLHEQFKEILNLPTINSLKHPLHDQVEEFEVPKLNSIHHDDFPILDHKKLTLATKNLHEHWKDILANNRMHQMKKLDAIEKPQDKSGEIELELTSAEVKKVLADRVKSRAAKTNVRFTNEELTEIMKKATEKLKHDHTLRARTGIKSSRLKRDINMKLLNEASKNKLKRKDINEDYEDSLEVSPKKKTSKKVIVNPFYKKTAGQRKKPKSSENSNMASSELDDDFDLYFEEEDKKPQNSHTNEKMKKKNPCSGKKHFNVGSRDNDLEEEDEVNRKYMRLDEYFRNAKEVQEKFDDIDFSDEEDYSNMEEDDIKRHKRETTHIEHENIHSVGCSCSHLLEDIIKTFQKVINSDNKEDYESLKQKLENYDKLMKSTQENKENKKSNSNKQRRSLIGFHQEYRPISDTLKRWRPEDVLSMKPRNILPAKNGVMINDLPLYQHLLHKNEVKRSLGRRKGGNFILKESEESLDSILNTIDKDDSSEYKDEERDFELVFPDKNKLELVKNKNLTRITFEHPKSPSVNSTNEGKTNSSSEKKEEVHGKIRLFQKNLSNIQVIPKNGTESFLHHAFDHLHSFIHKIGSKIKSYFHDIFE